MDEYKIKAYTYIDDLNYRIDPYQIFGDQTDEEKNIVTALFKKYGWEGDGELKLIWIPPFLYRCGPSTGKFVWHVKQNNNGISFLAYKGDFPFISEDWQPTEFEKSYFKTMIDGFKETLNEQEKNLNKISSIDKLLLSSLLNGIHADLISSFNEFLNDFSLEIFHELIINNNPHRLKINYNPKFSFSFKKVSEETDSLPVGTYDGNYVFFHTLIQALYDNFKFEPYEERIKVVCKTFDFDFFPKFGSKLRKQVEIRNAFQHRQWQLDKKSYNAIGSKVEIKQQDGTYIEYKTWKKIVLTIEEIQDFITLLKDFCDDFMNSIKIKIETV